MSQEVPYLVVKVDQRGAAGLPRAALRVVERGDFLFRGVGDPGAGTFRTAVFLMED